MKAAPPCRSPLAWETLVAYWARDLPRDEEDAAEEHLLGCAACSRESARVAAVTEALRALVPPIVTHGTVEAWRARGLRVEENVLAPGERKEAVVGPHLDLLVQRLGGLDLTDADSVEVTLRDETTGSVVLEDLTTAFDRDSGEILIACHRHYVHFPPHLVVEIRARRAAAADDPVARYTLLHTFV